MTKVICKNCDRETSGARYCSKECFVKDAFPRLEESAGFNRGIYKFFTLDKFLFESDDKKEDQDLKILYQKIRKYLEDTLDRGLFIYGSVGIGKTHLTFAVVREVMKTLAKEAKIFSVPRMIADYKDNNFDSRIIRKAEAVEIAVFDDLGSEYQDKNNLSTELLTRIIDERLVENRLTFFTSNLSPKMIGETMDSRLISRIKAMTYSIEMKGKDRRNE